MGEAQRPSAAAWRTYLELASGLGEASRKQVRKAVRDIVGKGNATAEQLKAMTGELLAVNTVNREALGKLIKLEVDRALGRVGLATMDEVNELTARVRDLERQLRAAKASQDGRTALGEPAATKPPAAKTTATKTTAAKTTAAKAGTKAAAPKAAKAAKTTPAKATAAAGTATSPVVKKATRKAAGTAPVAKKATRRAAQ